MIDLGQSAKMPSVNSYVIYLCDNSPATHSIGKISHLLHNSIHELLHFSVHIVHGAGDQSLKSAPELVCSTASAILFSTVILKGRVTTRSADLVEQLGYSEVLGELGHLVVHPLDVIQANTDLKRNQ